MIDFSAGRAVPSNLVVPSALDRAERTALELYGPPGVVIDERLQVLGFRGQVAPYFEPVPGTSDLNVLRWVRSELHADLRRAIEQALAGDVRVVAHCKLQDSGEPKPLRMEVVPISYEEAQNDGRCLLVSFQEPPASDGMAELDAGVEVSEAPPPVPKRVLELERELFVTQRTLQRTAARIEAAKEELESCRVEARSAREELESTREELDTWKQELSAVRQELTRVNVALEYRAAQQQRALDELQTALAAADDAVVVADLDHRVRLLSRAAEQLFGKDECVVGQSLAELGALVRGAQLEELCSTVIEKAQSLSTFVEGPEGRPYELRVSPYRALEQRVDGTALVFAPVERRKRSYDLAREVLARAGAYLRGVRSPLMIIDTEKSVVWANDGFCEFFRVHLQDILGTSLSKFAAMKWVDRSLMASIDGALAAGRPFRGHRVWLDVPERGAKALKISGGRLPAAAGEPALVLLSLSNAGEPDLRVVPASRPI